MMCEPSSEECIWMKEIEKEISYEAALQYGLVDADCIPASQIVLKIIWETFSGNFVTTYEFLDAYENSYEYRKLRNKSTDTHKIRAMNTENVLNNSNMMHSTSGCLSPSYLDSEKDFSDL